MIGKRINISYGDQNYDFESIFPKTGTIVSRHKTKTVDDWYLVSLDEPFEYNGRVNEQILIRSRVMGKTLAEETSVFVLLIPSPSLLDQAFIVTDDFEHVVWGETKLY